MENDKTLFYIVAIVAIVAVFAMVFMAVSANKTTRVVTTTESGLTTDTEDNVGQVMAAVRNSPGYGIDQQERSWICFEYPDGLECHRNN